MSILTISQAAKILQVDIKTLQRWDEDNTFPALREKVSNNRIYDEQIVQEFKAYREARINEKTHLLKLKDIRKNVDRFISTIPLSSDTPTKIHDGKEMQRAYQELDLWYEELKRLRSVTITHWDVRAKLALILKEKSNE